MPDQPDEQVQEYKRQPHPLKLGLIVRPIQVSPSKAFKAEPLY